MYKTPLGGRGSIASSEFIIAVNQFRLFFFFFSHHSSNQVVNEELLYLQKHFVLDLNVI